MGIVGVGIAYAQGLGPIKGEITFAWFGGQSRVQKTDKILKLYQAQYPGVSVVEQNSDWDAYWNKLTIQASAGNIPCTVMMQNRWLATFADPKILRPLDDLVASGAIDVRGIAKSTLDSSRGPDGKLYQVPSSVFFNGVMYNRTWLQKAGLKEPEPSWNWDDMAQLLKNIKPHIPAGAAAAHNMAMEPDMFVSWVQSHGDKVFNKGKVAFSKKTLMDWFNYWENLRKAGLTDTPDVMVEENGNLIEQSDIANGRAFMTARPPNRLDSHQKVIDAVRPGEQLAVLPAPTGPPAAGGMWAQTASQSAQDARPICCPPPSPGPISSRRTRAPRRSTNPISVQSRSTLCSRTRSTIPRPAGASASRS